MIVPYELIATFFENVKILEILNTSINILVFKFYLVAFHLAFNFIDKERIQRPVSRAGSMTNFCNPLNLGLAASGARPRMMHSEVVRKAPTWR